MGFSSRASVKKQVSIARVIPPPASVISSPTGASLVLEGGTPTIGGVAVYPAGAQLVHQGGTPVYGAGYAAPTGASLVLSGGTPVFWTPKSLPNLVAWYSSTSFAALNDGDAIATWPDLSGNGFDLTGTDKPVCKKAIQNGRAVARFNGTSNVLSNTSFPDFGDSYAIAVAASYDASDVAQGLLEVSNGTANTGFGFLLFSAAARFRYTDNANHDLPNGNLQDGNFHVQRGNAIGTSSTISFFVDGTAATTTYGTANPNTLNRIDVGKGFTLFHTRDIGEIIIYSVGLSVGNGQVLDAYLKYGWATP